MPRERLPDHEVSRGYTAGVKRITLAAGGDNREYLLFEPPAATGRRSDRLPLVVFLHGAGGTAEWADGETGWSALAGREQFLLVLPEARPPHPDKPPKFLSNPQRWNDGSPGPTGDPSAAGDVAFLAATVDDAVARTGADPRRVYVSGFSNGAGMAFRAAAELSDRVAAVAPVAGYWAKSVAPPARPVPTLYLIGDVDPLVPLRGGDVRSPWMHRLIRRPPVADTLERWARAIGCEPVPLAESDADGVRVERHPGPVEFRTVVVEGLGHHWPGGKGQLNHRIAGPSSGRANATLEIWRFFQKHAMV